MLQPTTRRLRLVSGFVLFAYVSTHFINHALGLISLEAMNAGRWWFLGIWRNPAGTMVLYGSLVTHAVLGLQALWGRQHLRMPPAETIQLGLGFQDTESFGVVTFYKRVRDGVRKGDVEKAQ